MSLYRNEGFSYSRKDNYDKRKRYLSFILVILLAIILATFTRYNKIYPLLVRTNAMHPFITNNSLLLISTIDNSIVTENEILVVMPNVHQKPILCNVVSTGNSTLYLKDKKISIVKNNKTFILPAKKFLINDFNQISGSIYPRDNIDPIMLNSGEFACINIYWDNIYDSRTYGKFSTENIIGKAISKNIIYRLPSFSILKVPFLDSINKLFSKIL